MPSGACIRTILGAGGYDRHWHLEIGEILQNVSKTEPKGHSPNGIDFQTARWIARPPCVYKPLSGIALQAL
jgi:hypothetical protein